jgi:hypothetical protein
MIKFVVVYKCYLGIMGKVNHKRIDRVFKRKGDDANEAHLNRYLHVSIAVPY